MDISENVYLFGQTENVIHHRKKFVKAGCKFMDKSIKYALFTAILFGEMQCVENGKMEYVRVRIKK